MKILLLGSSGTVGTAIEDVCSDRGIDCAGLTHEDIDITDFDGVRTAVEKAGPDAVINAVAIVGINQCELEPQRAFNVNAIAVSGLAKMCKERGIVLVQPSTHVVFDGTKEEPYTEDDLPNPASIFSVSKLAGEFFAQNMCSTHYIPRFPTLFGRRRNKAPGFVDKVVEWIKKGNELRIADDKIDSPTYTVDAAKAIISLLEEKKPFGVYHVANSGVVSYYDFVARLTELLNVDVKLIRAKDNDFPSLAHKPLRTALRTLRMKPLRSWEDALREYVARELK